MPSCLCCQVLSTVPVSNMKRNMLFLLNKNGFFLTQPRHFPIISLTGKHGQPSAKAVDLRGDMPDSDCVAHVFIDTNIALHFRRMDEIDWQQLTGVDKVVLVIAPVLIRELEDQKVGNHSRKIRDRADKTVKWLRKLFKGSKSIRDDVSLHFITHEPKIDFKSHDLSHDIADDQLIASALDYASQNTPVYIATDDTGVMFKVEAREGIKILELLDEHRLKAEPDKLEAENAKLRQRVALLESRIPKLSVAFEGGKSRQERFFTKPSMENVLSPLQIRKKYPLKDISIPEEKLPKPRGTIEHLKAHYGSPTYQNKKIEEYYESYDKYYADRVAYKEEISLRFWLRLVISNDGTAPASGIDLYLYLPEGVKAVANSPEEPKCPSPPGERLHNPMRDWHLHNYAHLVSAHSANRNNGKPSIEDNGSVVRISVDNLKHGFEHECDYITLRFQDWQSFKSFEMKFSISANEIPEATEGTLHVIAKVREQPGTVPAKIGSSGEHALARK